MKGKSFSRGRRDFLAATAALAAAPAVVLEAAAADKAQRAGLSIATVQALEQRPAVDPRLSTIRKLAAALGVPITELLPEDAGG
jgi:transcriptional regulator with XRE-family HTH domain